MSHRCWQQLMTPFISKVFPDVFTENEFCGLSTINKNQSILITCLHFLKSSLQSNPGENYRLVLKQMFFPQEMFSTLGMILDSVTKHHLL